MKESLYNLYTPIAQGILYFNTYSDALAIIPSDIHNALQKGDFDTLNPTKLQMLKENGFIVADDIDEYTLLEQEYKKTDSSGIYYMTILPSLDCNVRCWYCFEKHIKGSRLSAERQEHIFRYAKQILDREEIITLYVSLFGGEPLLYFKEEVYPLLSRIKEYATSIGKYMALAVTTNALCIDEESIPLFAEFKTGFQISIDGYKEKHDSIKKAPGIESAYKVMMQAIHMLTGAYDTRINLRLNYDAQTLTHLSELVADIEDIDRSKIKIHLERVWQTLSSMKIGEITLKDAIDILLSKNFCVSYLNFSRRNIACLNDARNGVILSYDGSVYKCTGRDFTQKTQEGILTESGCIRWNDSMVENRQRIKTYDNPVCRTCKLLPQCWGPCSQKQLEQPDAIKQLCQLNAMEMSMDDYIRYRFNNAYIYKRNFGDEHPALFF